MVRRIAVSELIFKCFSGAFLYIFLIYADMNCVESAGSAYSALRRLGLVGFT